MRNPLGLFVLLLALAPLPTRAELGAAYVHPLEEIAKLVLRDRNHCDRMAADLDAYADRHAAALRAQSEKADQASSEDWDAFNRKYRRRIEAAIAKLRKGLARCSTHPKVAAAMARLDVQQGSADKDP
jgi:hypothetical protein